MELQPHQQRVVDRMKTQDKLLVYHGTGSGKTSTALAVAESQKMPLTAIGPASLRNNFAKEKAKHHLNVDVHAATYNKPPRGDVKGVLAFDEAHKMGRAGTQRSKLPERVHGQKTMFLTGTPIRNEPSELVPLMRGLGVPVSRDAKIFNKQFVGERTVTPNLWDRVVHGVKPGVEYHAQNKDVLRKMLHGKVDYYKSEGKGYPMVKERSIHVEMTPEQESAYDMALKKHPSLAYKVRKGIAPSKSESNNMNAFLTATRQISNTPAGYNLKATSHDAPKINAAASEIEKHIASDKNYRGVTYSTYLGHGVHPMAEVLTKKKIGFGMYTGQMSQAEKDKVVKSYNEGKIKHLLISGAGGEGLDLKGTKLMQVMEPHWNEPQIDQVKARAVRFESHQHLPEAEREVEIQNFIAVPRKHGIFFKTRAKGTDEYLQGMAKRKQHLNDEFLSVLKDVGSEKQSQLQELYMQEFEKTAYNLLRELGKDGLGIARKDMPQLRGDDVKSFIKHLESKGIESEKAVVHPNTLKPTQSHISSDKVDGFKANIGKQHIIVSREGRILDGHHRWAHKMVNDSEKIKVIKVDAPIKTLINKANAFTKESGMDLTKLMESPISAAAFKDEIEKQARMMTSEQRKKFLKALSSGKKKNA